MEEFKGRMDAEVRRQEKLNRVEEKDFRRGELPGKICCMGGTIESLKRNI